MSTFDAVVVGAGPAGLSAAAELSRQGSCLLLERGPLATRRRRDAPRDLLCGVGGAGLFSDGKHSFHPAASALWALPDARSLEGAFDATASLLLDYGVDAGAFSTAPAAAITPDSWHPKRYPALYVPFEKRLACIQELWARGADRWEHAEVVGSGRAAREVVLEIERGGQRQAVRTRRLVVATGRWSPRSLPPWLRPLGVGFGFGRVEFGVRLETRADDPLFARLPGVDGKLRFVDADRGVEFRTFCTCRHGEVVLGEAEGLQGFSGRADGPHTSRSNVGLLVRTVNPDHGREIIRAFAVAQPSSFSLDTWPGPLPSIYGADGAALLTSALERLRTLEPGALCGRTQVHAPCIEGIGAYPLDDGSLEAAPGVWIAGDAIGRFRGLVASMVSGRYVARRIIHGRAAS